MLRWGLTPWWGRGRCLELVLVLHAGQLRHRARGAQQLSGLNRSRSYIETIGRSVALVVLVTLAKDLLAQTPRLLPCPFVFARAACRKSARVHR